MPHTELSRVTPESLAIQLDQRAAALEQQVIAWRRDIHQHPEIACHEHRTSTLVADHLRKIGFDEVRTGLGGGTGVVGILRGSRPGPAVALRADMDALPVEEKTGLPFASTAKVLWDGRDVPVMHACGHDAHTAIAMGAAQVLAELREHLPGTIMMVFQPAEEGPPPGWQGKHGAGLMVAEGALSNPTPDAIYGLHVVAGIPRGTAGRISYHTGIGGFTMHQLRIVIDGKGGHASMPWKTIDPLVAGAQVLLGLQTIISRNVDVYENDATLSIGSFHGGDKFNVIPDTVWMEGALRVTDASSRERLEQRIEQVVGNIAAAAGAEGRIEWGPCYRQLVNHTELAAYAATSFARAAGPGGLVVQAPPFALDDFSEFVAVAPTLFFTVDVPPHPDDPCEAGGHHTPTFRVNEDALIVGVRAMLHVSVDTLHRGGPGSAV